RPNPQPKQEEKKEEIKEITLPEKMTIRELAEKMKMQPSVIVKKLFLEGILVTVNHEIDFEKAQEIALSYDIIAEPEEKIDVIEELLREEEEDNSLLVSRPPVVCVMGHVDHGKTSLLDAIRNTHVTDKEAGGITQHIGAYVVSINGQKITFLDTPGHEAFTAMRMRGANATDIAILVVAADDGVMPQTVEAINHAKAAGTEIIVAVNKIDKPSANVEKVKQELSEYELIPEDWGGSTIFVPVSAHSGDGIDELLEMILLTAEVGELKANPKRKARGLVIEAELDKGKGPVATILVQKGTLQVGDFIAAGSCSGKVRAMMDDKGRRVKEAGPSTPVEILGLSDVPNAGEILVALDNDKEAKQFAETFVSEGKNKLLEDTKAKMSLDDLFTQIKAGNLKELPIVVKADVQGSVEAVKQSLVKLSNEEVIVKVIHGGVGAINESDVTLASASNAIIIGFNVRPDATAKAIAEQEGVDLRLYRVIYQAIEDVEAAMKGMLDPVYEEKVIGHGEVRQTFKASGIGTIAGSYVLDGIFQRGCKVRITREDEQIFEGPLASLKRFKDDVKEVKAGYECGLVFQDFNDVKEEDKVEAYIMVEVPR
ncbi:translation initiation factor IF-2, partial [Lactonifactor longoviformis]